MISDPSELTVDLSVVIVNYNGGELLELCLRSLYENLNNLNFEIILVDNCSTDSSLQIVEDRFPQVYLIKNTKNLGYAKANNQAIRRSTGRYVLLLNPDTALTPNSVRTIVNFMERHPEVGICGPKVILPDGKLDAPCRRSFKTPATYFYKVFGLSKLFPKNKRFGKYYFSYLNENEITEVDAVIGAFLMIRIETIDQIGLLDEQFFMYCEDEDWCYRAKKAGWKVFYNPEAQVIHYKGTSTRQRSYRMVYEWHKAICLFHRKNIADCYPFVINGFVYVSMGLKFVVSILMNVFKPRSPSKPKTSFKLGSSAPLSDSPEDLGDLKKKPAI